MKWGLPGGLVVFPALSVSAEVVGTNKVSTARVLKVGPAAFDLDRDGRLNRKERSVFCRKLEELRRAAPSPAMTHDAPRKVPGVQDRCAETIQRALSH